MSVEGKHVLMDAELVIGSLDVSNHTKMVDQDLSVDAVEVTAMSNVNHVFAPGLGSSKLSGELYQDYAAGSIHAVLSAYVLAKTIITCYVQPASGAESATNPQFVNTYFISKYKGVAGSVGAAHMTPFELSPTGDLAIDVT
jgi:hypothetical protein